VIMQRFALNPETIKSLSLTFLNKIVAIKDNVEDMLTIVYSTSKYEALEKKTAAKSDKKPQAPKKTKESESPKKTETKSSTVPLEKRLSDSLNSKKFEDGTSYADVLKNKSDPKFKDAQAFRDKKRAALNKQTKSTEKQNANPQFVKKMQQVDRQAEKLRQSNPTVVRNSIEGKNLNGPAFVTGKVMEVFGTLSLGAVLAGMNQLIPKERGQRYNFSAITPYLCKGVDGRPALTVPANVIGAAAYMPANIPAVGFQQPVFSR